MKVLLDTCALIWFLRGDPELSEKAAQLIENPDTDAFVSVVSIWEIAIKASIGKLPAPVGLQDSLEDKLKTPDSTSFLSISTTLLESIRFPQSITIHSIDYSYHSARLKSSRPSRTTLTGLIHVTISPSSGKYSERLQCAAQPVT